jgi:hypothetical protein
MGNVPIFMSFDLDHDQDLHDRLLEQSMKRASGFEISGRSEARTTTDLWDERLRRRICEADEVIVICGEHTAASMRVSAELRIAQEEQKPYLGSAGEHVHQAGRIQARRGHVQLDLGNPAESDRYDSAAGPTPRDSGALQAALR